MIGLEGWIEVAGVITKLGCMIALLFQSTNLPFFQNFWNYQKIIENSISVFVSGKIFLKSRKRTFF